MIFRRRTRKIDRILIVEDEPLVAFDNEHVLADAGYEIAATVDNVPEAIAVIGRDDSLDLVLTDVSLSRGGDGTDVARAAEAAGVPVLFVTGGCPPEARKLAVGCLLKPYQPRDLTAALAVIDDLLSARKPGKAPANLVLYRAATDDA